MIAIMALLAGFVIVLLGAALLVTLFRRPTADPNLSNSLQNLADSLRESRGDVKLVSEKLTSLSSVPESLGSVQTELTKLSERVSTVERNQNQVNENVHNL